MNNYQTNGKGRKFNDNHPQEKNQFALQFRSEWVTDSVTEECVNLCETLAKALADDGVSTSLLRNIFGEMRRIEVGGFEQHKAEFILLRPKLAYTCGRAIDRSARTKEILTDLQELYKKAAHEVKSAEHFKNLVSIMEAIVAFHKVNGGNK